MEKELEKERGKTAVTGPCEVANAEGPNFPPLWVSFSLAVLPPPSFSVSMLHLSPISQVGEKKLNKDLREI